MDHLEKVIQKRQNELNICEGLSAHSSLLQINQQSLQAGAKAEQRPVEQDAKRSRNNRVPISRINLQEAEARVLMSADE